MSNLAMLGLGSHRLGAPPAALIVITFVLGCAYICGRGYRRYGGSVRWSASWGIGMVLGVLGMLAVL